jgi:succinate dehydrogenase/fumarate reductase cytochrome b subunit
MQPPDALPPSWQRLLALSGVVFGVLFLVGWFASGGDAPDYAAADADWTEWADDNQWRSRIGAFAMLLAGFVLLHFAATIRTALGDAERRAGGSAQLARVAFAGAITGMAGMAMAIVIISGATTEGADANPIVTRAVATASAGPFLLSAMGFAAFLAAGGLVTLRSGVFARWTGVVALIGAVSFLVAFAAILSGLGEDSVFGFGFFPGVLAVVIWSIATSIASYRAVATRHLLANEVGT